MAKDNGSKRSSPAGPPPTLQKSTSGSQPSKNQKSILGFFQKRPSALPTRKPSANKDSRQILTPAPSSDALCLQSSPHTDSAQVDNAAKHHGLPSPVTPVGEPQETAKQTTGKDSNTATDSPSRKVRVSSVQRYTDVHHRTIGLMLPQAKKAVNYAESADEDDDEDEGDVFRPVRSTSTRGRASKRRRTSLDDESADEFLAEEDHDGAVDGGELTRNNTCNVLLIVCRS